MSKLITEMAMAEDMVTVDMVDMVVTIPQDTVVLARQKPKLKPADMVTVDMVDMDMVDMVVTIPQDTVVLARQKPKLKPTDMVTVDMVEKIRQILVYAWAHACICLRNKVSYLSL
jgi:hypothetical protein